MAIHTLYLQRKGYTSKEDRQLLEDIYGPIERVLDEGGLIATAVGGGSYQVSVSAGRCLIKGDTNANQGMYRLFSDTAEVRTHSPHATNPRIDLIVARVYDFTEVGSGPDQGDIEIVQGTATSGADLTNLTGAPGQGGGPTIPDTAMPLYYVRVPTSGGIAATDLLDYRPRIGGKSIIATEESRTNTAFGLLTTPDRVQNIVMPTEGILFVQYFAHWKNSVAVNGSAAIFIGSNQLKIPQNGSASPVIQEALGNNNSNVYRPLSTHQWGLHSNFNAVDYTADVSTGMVLASGDSASSGHGGPVSIFLPAGTYDVSVQFKAASGSVTAKNRKLWVWTKNPSIPSL